MKRILSVAVAASVLALGLVGCGGKQQPEQTKAPEQQQAASDAKQNEKAGDDKTINVTPNSGFNEIEIGSPVEVGPFEIAMVYFQGVDMVPQGRQPSAAESDMHLEADIHLTKEGSVDYGFGGGDSVWPAYLTVEYKVLDKDGKEVTSGSMMPMNADDGAHYGVNIKKGVVPIGQYKIELSVQPSQDYLLHVDGETGVPLAKDKGGDASTYYQKQTATFDWNYDGSQLPNS